jgi:aspartyl-tRNA(Asn)/glutamyl-tRNA(Gln) amidotransferase subunit A
MNIQFASILEVGRMLRAGEVSSEALTTLMLERIDAYNDRLNAFITVTGDMAVLQARQADRELGDGRDRGPLHGIPVAVKDLFDTRGTRTTCGSRLFESRVPEHDAAAVTRLREAGAVMLGKTGLHELAYGHSSINPYFGAVRNPWNPDHDPGGSSDGGRGADRQPAGGLRQECLEKHRYLQFYGSALGVGSLRIHACRVAGRSDDLGAAV